MYGQVRTCFSCACLVVLNVLMLIFLCIHVGAVRDPAADPAVGIYTFASNRYGPCNSNADCRVSSNPQAEALFVDTRLTLFCNGSPGIAGQCAIAAQADCIAQPA
jgi:hypothetical protein